MSKKALNVIDGTSLSNGLRRAKWRFEIFPFPSCWKSNDAVAYAHRQAGREDMACASFLGLLNSCHWKPPGQAAVEALL